VTFVGTVPLKGARFNSADVQSAKIRAKKKELHMVEEQNSAVYDHRAISPAGFNY
jgi:hypothetical protein